MSRNPPQVREINALNVDEARNFIKSGGKRVHLAWDISSDEFFSLACSSELEGMRIIKEEHDFYLESMPN